MSNKRYYVLAEELEMDLAVVNFWMRNAESLAVLKGLFNLKIIIQSWLDVLE